jgi:hypothetical protein
MFAVMTAPWMLCKCRAFDPTQACSVHLLLSLHVLLLADDEPGKPNLLIVLGTNSQLCELCDQLPLKRVTKVKLQVSGMTNCNVKHAHATVPEVISKVDYDVQFFVAFHAMMMLLSHSFAA